MYRRQILILLTLLVTGSNAIACNEILNGGPMTETPRKPRILFMCVANSARSQLAEALAREVFGDRAIIQSAGSEPKTVNPFAMRVLEEIGVGTEHMTSKGIQDLPGEFIQEVDLVITLCADEVCPILPSRRARKLHWPYPDPAGVQGADADKLQAFRETRDLIKSRILELSQELGFE